MEDLGLAEIKVVTDGGPWATHNFPCPVCRENKAILNLNEGVMEPCGRCSGFGWQLVHWKNRRWSKLTRWLRYGYR